MMPQLSGKFFMLNSEDMDLRSFRQSLYLPAGTFLMEEADLDVTSWADWTCPLSFRKENSLDEPVTCLHVFY